MGVLSSEWIGCQVGVLGCGVRMWCQAVVSGCGVKLCITLPLIARLFIVSTLLDKSLFLRCIT